MMLRRHFVVATSAVLAAAWKGRVLVGAETDAAADAPPNWQMPTFGGLQYWADEFIYDGYRIQRHTSTGHHRLLNAGEERLAWGTYEQCRAKFDEIKKSERLKPLPRRLVLTMHGIIRTRHSMNAMAAYLRKQGHTVYQVGYPSTHESMHDLAATFDRLVRRFEGVEEIDVVGYSMGNLVLRHWLGDVLAEEAARQPAVEAGKLSDVPQRPRLHRSVMIGPPNNGATRANLWQTSTVGRELFGLVLGDAGQQLGPRFHEIKDRLATPEAEFGIIAGGKGDGEGWHDEIPGDDDGTVGVDEAKLPGAADFRIVPERHTFLTLDSKVQAMTDSFIRHGYFESEAKRVRLAKS
jgi:hypothetical protein